MTDWMHGTERMDAMDAMDGTIGGTGNGMGGMDGMGGAWNAGPGGWDAGADGWGAGEPGPDAADVAGGGAGGMVVRLGDAVVDLGPADAEPGVADSVTVADDDGLTIYTDTDGDGTVDEIVTVKFDGTWETWDASGSPTNGGGDGAAAGSWGAGDWELRESGRWG